MATSRLLGSVLACLMVCSWAVGSELLFSPALIPTASLPAEPEIAGLVSMVDVSSFPGVVRSRPAPPVPVTTYRQSAQSLCLSPRVGSDFYCSFVGGE